MINHLFERSCMTIQSEPAYEIEHRVLTTDVGRDLLDRVGRVKSPGPGEIARWRSFAPMEWVQAAIRLLDSQRRAAAKYTRADEMWLDPVGIEQSTAEEVARYKAGRFAGRRVVDLCSGIGGDALALAERHEVLAIDRDPGMCRRLEWNARVYEVRDRLQPILADARRFAAPHDACIHVDPDRRTAAGRSRDRRVRLIEEYLPGPSTLKSLARSSPGMAIKLSPASDFEMHFAESEYEVELISLRGECKEATVWCGEAKTCRRRATRLPEGISWTDRDARSAGGAAIFAGAEPRWIYDPDPALLRSGLTDGFAIAHSLSRWMSGVDYLVGESLVASPFLAAFEVLDVFPLDLKRLRRELARREIGRLEIKVRGAEVVPEALRTSLKLGGNRSASLLIGGQGPTRAILAQRVGPP